MRNELNKRLATSDERPLFSIITIVYNGQKTLERTIQSVINQTNKDLEYIIIDGGSTDGTIDILKKYNDHIDYWLSEPDEGISDAFNKGVKLAKGQFVGILNADDWYEQDACEIIAKNIDDKSDVYFGDCRIWNAESSSVGKSDARKIHTKMSIYHPTCFVRNACYVKYGAFSKKYKISMDYDLLLRLKGNGCTFKYIDQVIANFQLGGVSNLNKHKGAKESFAIKNVYLPNRKFQNYLEYKMRILKTFIGSFRNTKTVN